MEVNLGYSLLLALKPHMKSLPMDGSRLLGNKARMTTGIKAEHVKARDALQDFIYSDEATPTTPLERTLVLQLLRQSLIHYALISYGATYEMASVSVDAVLEGKIPETDNDLFKAHVALEERLVELKPTPIGKGVWTFDDNPQGGGIVVAYFEIYKESLTLMRAFRKRFGGRIRSFRLVFDPTQIRNKRFQVQVLRRTFWGGEKWKGAPLESAHHWQLNSRSDYHFQVQSAFEEALRDLDELSKVKVVSYIPMSGGDKAGGLSTPIIQT